MNEASHVVVPFLEPLPEADLQVSKRCEPSSIDAHVVVGVDSFLAAFLEPSTEPYFEVGEPVESERDTGGLAGCSLGVGVWFHAGISSG